MRTMKTTTRTTNLLLRVVAHSRRPVLRTYHSAFSQRLEYLEYLYSPSTSRSLSTTTTTTTRSTPTIPAPTWSLESLELSQTHAPVSHQELSRLAKRVVLDLAAVDVSHKKNGTINNNNNAAFQVALAQDLGNMMHMIRQVQSLPETETENLSDADIYDVPRGVTEAPVRREDTNKDSTATTRPKWWESLLKPHTTMVGAHSYFVVCTQRDEKNSN
jgi:hypothetical protein